jgi:hypothetical protein
VIAGGERLPEDWQRETVGENAGAKVIGGGLAARELFRVSGHVPSLPMKRLK